jgi:integrase
MGLYGHCWSRAGAEKSWWQVRAALGLSDVWLHDFRRTVATRLYEAEGDELLVKACLNHYDGRPIAVYVRLNFDRLARALQAQADRLFGLKKAERMLGPVPTIIVNDKTAAEPMRQEWPG